MVASLPSIESFTEIPDTDFAVTKSKLGATAIASISRVLPNIPVALTNTTLLLASLSEKSEYPAAKLDASENIKSDNAAIERLVIWLNPTFKKLQLFVYYSTSSALHASGSFVFTIKIIASLS
jgi:hypothetical protein